MKRRLSAAWTWAPVVVIGGTGVWYLSLAFVALVPLLLDGEFGWLVFESLLRGSFYVFVAYVLWENERLRERDQRHNIATSKAFVAGFEAGQGGRGRAA